MRHLLTRSVFGKTGQQTYRVPGGHNAAPTTVTVAGAAATFTSAVDTTEGIRTITISAPTVTDGQEIKMSFDGTTSMSDPAAMLVENPENLDTGLLSAAGAGAKTLCTFAVGNRNLLTLSVTAIGVGTTYAVEVTNDPTGLTGWGAVRGMNASDGSAAAAPAAIGNFSFKCAGFRLVRIRVSAQTSGTSTGYASLSYGSEIAGSIS